MSLVTQDWHSTRNQRPLQDTFKMIQTGAWPVALYAAEHTYIGKQHFQDLRKAVTFAAVGKRHYANAWITCSFVSRYITDPQLYVILNAVRHLRRLASSNAERLNLFLRLLDGFQGCRPFGPASTLKVYLDNVGWSLDHAGVLRCGVYQCNVWPDSFRCNRVTLLEAWPAVVLCNLDRKGTGEFLTHPTLSASVFSSFSEEDQRISIYYFTGALQTDSVKARWNSDQIPLCPFCNEVDSRPHRLLHCAPLQSIRESFPDAVSILTNVRDESCYLPLARSSPETDLVGLINSNFPDCLNPQAFQVKHDNVTFFLGVGAMHPQVVDARIAAWAVIQDLSCDDVERRLVADITLAQPPRRPNSLVFAL